MTHTTVLRRVNAFEAAQGLRLFERLPTGYALTVGGEEMLAAARRMSGVVADLERRLAGQDLRVEGTLRVATTDTLRPQCCRAISRPSGHGILGSWSNWPSTIRSPT